MPRHHYKERYAVYIGTTTPFTSERLRRLWWNWHSAHFGMATPFGRNLQYENRQKKRKQKAEEICGKTFEDVFTYENMVDASKSCCTGVR